MESPEAGKGLDPVVAGGLLGAAAGLLILHPVAALAAATMTGQSAFDAIRDAYGIAAAGLLFFHILMGAVIGVAASSMVNAEFRRRLVREREAAALREQLLQAQKLESVGRLAAGVAHDFNNVLSALNIQLHLAQQGCEDGPAAERVAQAKRITDKGAELPKQLLTFARKGKTAPARVDLLAAVEDMQVIMERLVGPGIELVVDGTPGATVRIDPSQFDQVLLNLVVNARDALEGRGRVSIRIRDDAEACVLEVADDGPGIPEDVLPHLFEPFFTTKGVGRGSGLGLATTYGIITQHGGTIEVTSRPGGGTVFILRLPRTPKRDLPEATVAVEAVAGSTSGSDSVL